MTNHYAEAQGLLSRFDSLGPNAAAENVHLIALAQVNATLAQADAMAKLVVALVGQDVEDDGALDDIANVLGSVVVAVTEMAAAVDDATTAMEIRAESELVEAVDPAAVSAELEASLPPVKEAAPADEDSHVALLRLVADGISAGLAGRPAVDWDSIHVHGNDMTIWLTWCDRLGLDMVRVMRHEGGDTHYRAYAGPSGYHGAGTRCVFLCEDIGIEAGDAVPLADIRAALTPAVAS